MNCHKHHVHPETRELLQLDEILRLDSIYVDALHFKMQIQNVEENVIQTLRAGGEHYPLAASVCCMVIDAVNRILYFVRNELGQYNVALISENRKEWTLLNFGQWGAQWRVGENNSWQAFRPAIYNRLSIDRVPVQLDSHSPITEEKATELLAFASRSDAQSGMYKILMANARQHFSERNHRMAILEAVIALESVLRRFLSDAVKLKSQTPNITARDLDSFWRDVGLYSIVTTGLRWWFSTKQIPGEVLKFAAEGVVIRNNIVHNAQRHVDKDKAKEYLKALLALADYLSQDARLLLDISSDVGENGKP